MTPTNAGDLSDERLSDEWIAALLASPPDGWLGAPLVKLAREVDSYRRAEAASTGAEDREELAQCVRSIWSANCSPKKHAWGAVADLMLADRARVRREAFYAGYEAGHDHAKDGTSNPGPALAEYAADADRAPSGEKEGAS